MAGYWSNFRSFKALVMGESLGIGHKKLETSFYCVVKVLQVFHDITSVTDGQTFS